MSDQSSLFSDNYESFFRKLKEQIRSAQVKAALAVNKELVTLYWRIGREILERQQEAGWGAKVVDRLAQDLKTEFPDITGFSPRNLKYMRSFGEAYPDEKVVHQLGAQIPWKHNCVILDKVKDPDLRIWYIQKTIENGWSRVVLIHQIDSSLHA